MVVLRRNKLQNTSSSSSSNNDVTKPHESSKGSCDAPTSFRRRKENKFSIHFFLIPFLWTLSCFVVGRILLLQSHIEVFQFQEDLGIFSVPLDHGLLSNLKVKNAKNVVFIPGKITPASERKHTSSLRIQHQNPVKRETNSNIMDRQNDEKIITHYLDSLPEPKSTLLPKRLFVVVGLESSGTKFVSERIASLLGIDDVGERTAHGRISFGRAEIQHFSLPWGSICTQHNLNKEDNGGIIPFVPPRECGTSRNKNDHSLFLPEHRDQPISQCPSLGLPDLVEVPPRFLVNITSHVHWYEERGVQVTAVIVSRDRNVVRASASKAHCTDKATHEAEIESGERIIRDAIEKLNSPRRSYEIESSDKVSPLSKLVFVSYESLLELRNDGYMEYFRWQLGLPTISFTQQKQWDVDRNKNARFFEPVIYRSNGDYSKAGEQSSLYPAEKKSLRDIPNQIITVIGLESSGSKFISQLLYPYFERIDKVELDYQTLPGGNSFVCTGRDERNMLPFLPPFQCREDIQNCQALQQQMNEHRSFDNVIPDRYFLDLISHFDWYDKRGIPSTAVIVTRDPTVTQASAAKAHCHNLSVHTSEFGFGNDLIGEFLRIQSNPDTAIKSTNVVIVSYESMISLGISYLHYVLKQIDNEYDLSKVNQPSIDIIDMNKKYLFDVPHYLS